jgi:NitT/TauT family transport system ATP-binding protein
LLEPLPDYRNPPPEARAHLESLRQRSTVLRIDDVSRVFGGAASSVAALEDVSFEVRHGEFICVIGASGCGKSTLVRILAGLDAPSSGQVLLDDEPVEAPGADRGMVFQRYTLFPWLSVRDNVTFGLRLKGASKAHVAKEAAHWLEVIGLSAFADYYPEQLSGGMKQRVAIARALANRPRILLMDEPFGALDAQTRSQMQHHLLDICRATDVTVFFITHDLDEAVFLADRVVVLAPRPGRVQEIIDVPLVRPRTQRSRLDPYFLAVRQRLEELIHPAREGSSEALHE